MAVLKANAYGHGIQLAETAMEAGCSWIGIVDNWEAKYVRDHNLKTQHQKPVDILRLRPATDEEILDNLNNNLNMHEVVGCLDDAQRMNQLAEENGSTIDVHLKMDIGMGRSGFLPLQLDEMLNVAANDFSALHVKGVMAHFPSADDNLEVTQKQYSKFEHTMKKFCEKVNIPSNQLMIHCSNSAATLRLGTAMDMIRVGISSYGIAPGIDMDFPRDELKSCMRWTTQIASLRRVPPGRTIGYGMTFVTKRDSLIATLPFGYADGYWRSIQANNKSTVLISGKRCPVVGRISMNMITVDVTDLDSEPKVGDEVCIMGTQGDETITPEDIANLAGTIGYEVTIAAGYTGIIRGIHKVVESF